MKIIKTTHGLIKSWCNNPEQGAIDQAINLTKLPFIFKHICLMPDTHQGYGMPIGGVMATKGVIVPNAVGVDIGCGMLAVKTDLTELSFEDRKYLVGKIRENVPVGFKHHTETQKWTGFDNAPDEKIIQRELKSAQYQIGTLGGGNHFIEIQKGSDGFIWIMIHSGSRNIGFKIAKEYHDQAKKLCSKWYSDIPTPDLAFLPIDTSEAKNYIMAMDFAIDFALENRRMMLSSIVDAFDGTGAIFDKEINIHHNYARYENHYKTNVIVHRKGATSARQGEIGIIPGSQGTCSYIVEGKGSPESFSSCSHGAGRKMGRKQAKRELNLEAEKSKLTAMNIVHSIRNVEDLDEAPGAYKNIDTVMQEQADLIKPIVKLTPLAVVKG